ncbi:hypothetical protein BC829DRAFT_281156 [Chytridium lagenaria]|nr:hypothetical protein BC829DRAFT_281156 [Chytridium lagenaria]
MLRMKALKYLDRLDTFEAIRDFIRDTQELFPSAFLKFRDRDIVDIAKMFSAEGNVTALELLFTRHKELMPFRFEVLRELPVTLNPSDFRITLPRFDSRSELEILPKPIPWRQPDWTEANPQVSEVLLSFELADEHLFKCGINSGKPFDNAASGEVLSAWYNDFIRRIERETGQTSLALSLTIIAQSPEFNIPGLERTHHWLQTLSDLNYVCERLDIGLSELGEMSNEEIIQYFLAGSVDDIFSFTRKIKCVVVPYLERSKRLLEASAYSAFDSYLVEVASINIEACSKVFEMSRDGITEEERIIASPSRLAEVMLRCAYVPEITGADLSILHSFIRSLPDTTSIRSIDLTERNNQF